MKDTIKNRARLASLCFAQADRLEHLSTTAPLPLSSAQIAYRYRVEAKRYFGEGQGHLFRALELAYDANIGKP